MAFCGGCGARIADGTAFCPQCGTARGTTAPAAVAGLAATPEKYGMAALLSFFLPGLGQIIKGHILKAMLIWVGLALFIVLSFMVVGIPFLVFLWFWQIYDAYNSPHRG